MIAPYESNASACSSASLPGMGATTPGSADGFTISFSGCAAGGGVAGGVGGGAVFILLSSDPICSWLLYFLRMPSL